MIYIVQMCIPLMSWLHCVSGLSLYLCFKKEDGAKATFQELVEQAIQQLVSILESVVSCVVSPLLSLDRKGPLHAIVCKSIHFPGEIAASR